MLHIMNLNGLFLENSFCVVNNFHYDSRNILRSILFAVNVSRDENSFAHKLDVWISKLILPHDLVATHIIQ